MRIKATIISLGFVFLLAGFSYKQSEIPYLRPVKVKFGFRDSVFISYTQTIYKHGSYYYLNDGDNQRVLKFDSSLNLIKIFGRKGRGPGEFTKATILTANNDSLYVFDRGGMRFNVYTINGQYIRTFLVPYPIYSRSVRSVVINNKLYTSLKSYSESKSSILVMDLNGNLIKYFEPDPVHPEVNMTNHLLFSTPDNKEIIAVSTSTPFISRYSADGTFSGSFDLQKIDALDPLWTSYHEKKSENTRTLTHIIIGDAYMDGSFLYIACAGWPGRDDYTYIIKLAVKPRSIKPVSVFKITGLKGQEYEYMILFTTITVSGDTLIAYEAYTHSIAKFDLSKLP